MGWGMWVQINLIIKQKEAPMIQWVFTKKKLESYFFGLPFLFLDFLPHRATPT
jgi:hypothetical protein